MAAQPTPKAGAKRELAGKEIGDTGTVIVSGFISNQDYNAELTGSRRIETYDQMRKGDATVRAAIAAVTLPILSANWFVKPASDDQQDQEIARLVSWNLFEQLEISWTETLRQILLHLVYGSMAFEKVFEFATHPGWIGKLIWKKFAPRLPQTVLKWETEDGQPGITQFLQTKYGSTSIPMEKLLVFVNEKEGDNWEGISILRAAYKNWYIKEQLYRIDAIGLERQGIGIPYAKSDKKLENTERAKAEEYVKNIRANEESYAMLEGGIEIGFLDMKANTTRDPMRSIAHHDRQIVKSVLAQFLELGAAQSTGSYALSQDQSELFLLGLRAAANHVCETINRYAIRELVDLNYAGVTNYPSLDYSEIGRVNVDRVTASLLRLTQAGLLVPDKNVEDYVREIMDLPAAPDGFQEEQDLWSLMDEAMQEAGQDDTADTQETDPAESDVEAHTLLRSGKEGEPLSDETKRKISEALKKIHSKGDKKPKAKKVQDPKVKQLKSELQDYVMDLQLQIERKKAAGEKIAPSDLADMRVKLLEKKQAVTRQLRDLQASNHPMDAAIGAFERMERALDRVEA